jgi:hypothetical protein
MRWKIRDLHSTHSRKVKSSHGVSTCEMFFSTNLLHTCCTHSIKLSNTRCDLDLPFLFAPIFRAKISTEKLQRFKEIITVMENFKHDFWCTKLFIIVKSKPLINDQTTQIKKITPTQLFQLRTWYGSFAPP